MLARNDRFNPSCDSASREGAAGAAASAPAAPPPPLRSPDGSNTVIGFQCNERYLQWDDSAARQLIRIHVATQLCTSVDAVAERLAELAVLLPDMVAKLEQLKADLVVELCRDTGAVAARLLTLREVLPGVNVSACVASDPWLLSAPDPSELRHKLRGLGEALPGLQVEALVEAEPRLLVVDIAAVLAEVSRLVPGADPARVLAADPRAVLGMQDAGLPASLAVDDGIKAG